MEKVKKSNKRSKIFVGLMLVLIILFSISFTYAWFTDKKEKSLSMRFGSIALKITDDDGNKITSETLTFNIDRKYIEYQTGGKIMPGDVVKLNLNVGLEQISANAYYVVKITDTMGVFEDAIYFADGTKDASSNLVIYQTNGLNTWVQGDETKTFVDKKVGKITKDETHPMNIAATISTDYEGQNTSTTVYCQILAIQQANLSEEMAQSMLIDYLPSGYMKVEKIIGTNNATYSYNNGLNTSVAWKDISKIDVAMQFTSVPSDQPMLFSTFTSETTKSSPYIFVGDNSSTGFVDLTGTTTPYYNKTQLTNNGIKEFSITLNSNTQTGIACFGCWSDSYWSASWELSRLVIYGTNGEMLKNFVPSVRTSDGKVGFFEAVSKTFVANSNTEKEFIAGEYVIPDDYSQVEYIQSDGTQWIDTGFKPTNKTNIEIVTQSEDNTHDMPIFGVRDGTNQYIIWHHSQNSVTPINALVYGSRSSRAINYGTLSQKHTIKVVNGVFCWDDHVLVDYSSSVDTQFNCVNNAILFGLQTNGSIENRKYYGKIYSCKITNNGALERVFIPAVRNSDAKAGLLDLVENKFYPNLGSGDDFVISGQEIPYNYQEVEYLESTGVQSINTGVSISSSVTDFDVEMSVMWTNFSTRQLMGYSGDSGGYFGVNAGGYYDKGASSNSTIKASGSSFDKLLYSRKSGRDSLTANGQQVFNKAPDTTSGDFRLFSLGGSYLCYVKLEYCTIKVGGTIVRDFVPCIRRSDNKPGLFDKVNKQFYVNNKSGADFKTSLLSADYSQVSYLESTGTQHIFTDYTPNQNTKIEIDVAPTSVASNAAFFCARNSMTTNSFTLFLLSGQFRADYTSTQNSLYDGSIPVKAVAGSRYKISMQAGKITLNDKDYELPNTSFTAGSPLRLFASHQTYSDGNASSLGNFAQTKMYSCKIYESGLLVRNFIPVVRKSDSKAGLYDMVNRVFYENQGTGNFNFG